MTVTFDYRIIFEKEFQSLSVCYILTDAINKRTQTTSLIGILGETDDISFFSEFQSVFPPAKYAR